jgi:surface polysaccharide O-acyltransferase-like enzyme
MNKLKTSGRNEAVECCRLLASVLVVFLHCVFPGNLGSAVNCLARIAVPFFFIVSGYFAYGAGVPALGRRIVSAAKLNGIATGVFVLWGICKVSWDVYGNVGEWLRWRLSAEPLFQWLIFDINPFSGHLWYLTALLKILCVLYLFVRKRKDTRNYKPLYILAAVLGIVQFLLDSVAAPAGVTVPYYFHRNAVAWGFPMFCTGLFLHEYRDRLTAVFGLTKSGLLLIIAAGAGVSQLRWFMVGPAEMPAGTFFEAAALLLLAVSEPQVSGGREWLASAIGRFGSLSTYIYVVHLLFVDAYLMFWQEPVRAFLYRISGSENLEGYLYPLMIVAVSVLTGILWIGLADAVKGHRRK